ncbi:prepilin-type N-terminal cleavage/methylation domain-containing protein [Pedobacter sp. JY14-1]|uniref:PulJ/GspJ family protein n=1 Tax=Pedobacter sp. JY14-1 TaxID=3034151 RepID=UPI0023E0D7B2|nr:prepilin-type N-terminal cleavage/methylation domain-containing protein [Pedobacter sp. JY14-1]
MGNKIKAFTLMEVVLAMMLAAIVVGMAYTAFSLFGKLQGSYRQKNLRHADLQMVREVLQRDVERAGSVRLEGDRLLMDSLIYQAGGDFLLRQVAGGTDTLKLRTLRIQGSFEEHPVADGLADRLVLSFMQDSVAVQLRIDKQYTSEELFRLKEELWKR